jgi:hypothetical protein
MGAPHEDLKLLSLFHYVLAGVTALFALLPLVHVAIGVAMITGRFDGRDAPPPFLGWIFVGFGAAFILAGWVYAALVFFAGRCLTQRRAWLFVMVMAGISCAWMPFGTVLGVFTLVTLSRPEVKALFAVPGAPPPAAWGAPAPPPDPAVRS